MIHVPVRRLTVLVAVAALAVGACSGGATAMPILPPGGGASTAPSAAPTEVAGGGLPAGCPQSPPAPMAASDSATVTLATEKGDIVIGVKGSLGPLAAANFVALAECGAYDGVVFHRVAPGFVIQGGDVQYGRQPNLDEAMVGKGGPGYEFAHDPVTAPYLRGTVAMANSGPDTNGSQFFITHSPQPHLDGKHTVFGKVVAGQDVVDAICQGDRMLRVVVEE